jgi:hypothetical protein
VGSGERLAHWAMYWGLAVCTAAAPGMALLFAPVVTMSYRSDLIVRWNALARFFPLAQSAFGAMLGLALLGLVLGLVSLRGGRAVAAPSPSRYTHDAVFAVLLGCLGILLWGTALALSVQLAAVYRAWGLSMGLR